MAYGPTFTGAPLHADGGRRLVARQANNWRIGPLVKEYEGKRYPRYEKGVEIKPPDDGKQHYPDPIAMAPEWQREQHSGSPFDSVTAPLAEAPREHMTEKQRTTVVSAEKMEYVVAMYGGSQHMITVGHMYETHFIRAIPGAKVKFNRMLLAKTKADGGGFEVTVGRPLIEDSYVQVTILEHLRSHEYNVYKHKPTKHYQKRWFGTRKITRFRVDKVVVKGKVAMEDTKAYSAPVDSMQD